MIAIKNKRTSLQELFNDALRMGAIPIETKKIEKVIYNKPATILFINGKKYISKTHNEEFDKEKGLLMCLAKANGISHSQLKRIIKQSIDQSKYETTIEIQTLDGTKKKINVEEKND